MKRMIATAALSAVLCASAVWAAAEKPPQQVVDERVAGMKKMAGNVKGASEASANTTEAKVKIADAIKFAETIPAHFPKGTGIGDKGVTKSRALQDIWTKPDDFKTAASNLVAALKGVDTALDTGDAAKVGAAFKEIGKSCGGCHTPFRGPETP